VWRQLEADRPGDLTVRRYEPGGRTIYGPARSRRGILSGFRPDSLDLKQQTMRTVGNKGEKVRGPEGSPT
jgi:hypothetical protein